MNKLESAIHSRRVWVGVAGVAVVISEELGLSIATETIEQIVLMFAAWIVGDSLNKTDLVLHSRRVWLAVAGVAVALSEELGVSIPAETVEMIVRIFATWIVGDSLRKTE